VPLPASVDYDARDLDAAFPGRAGRSGLRKLTFDVRYTFTEPMRAQAEALRAMLDAEPADAVLAETGFVGTLPLLVDPRPRPPVVNVGVPIARFSSALPALSIPEVTCPTRYGSSVRRRRTARSVTGRRHPGGTSCSPLGGRAARSYTSPRAPWTPPTSAG
jgi:hypothetical protein